MQLILNELLCWQLKYISYFPLYRYVNPVVYFPGHWGVLNQDSPENGQVFCALLVVSTNNSVFNNWFQLPIQLPVLPAPWEHKPFICRVGIELSQVEVRFSNLQVVAEVQSGKRGNTNILNAYRNAIEVIHTSFLVWYSFSDSALDITIEAVFLNWIHLIKQIQGR